MPKITTPEDFWNHVTKEGSCWIWAGYIDKYGYGRHKAGYAHRFAYELHTGKMIREGRQIDHLCHHRACINPAHLRSVTTSKTARTAKARTRTTPVESWV